MTLFFIFLRSELARNGKNFSQIIQNILFFLLSCFLFFFLSNESQTLSALTATSIIFFCLLFSLLFSNSDFLKADFKDGTLEQMIIFCENLELFIFAKIIANFILFSLPVLAASALVLKLLAFDFLLIKQFILIGFFAVLAINFICAFCGGLNIAGSKMSMIAILIIPLIVPVLLIASASFYDVASDANFYKSLKLLIAIAIFFGAVTTFAITKIVKIVSE